MTSFLDKAMQWTKQKIGSAQESPEDLDVVEVPSPGSSTSRAEVVASVAGLQSVSKQ